MDHLRSGVQDQPGQHGKTLSLLKIQKKKYEPGLVSRLVILVTQETEAPVISVTQETEARESLEPGW